MMTNKHPWQTIVNPTLLSKVPAKQNTLSVVKGHGMAPQKQSSLQLVAARRYSFDDNGGGYQGL